MADQEVFTAPWYPWYVNDVLTSEAVDLMSLAEEGAYRRALDKAWKKGSLPGRPQDLAKTIGKSCPTKIAEAVLKMFVPMPDNPDRVIHLKLEKVRLEQFEKYKNKSHSGKLGADKRWHNHSDAIVSPMANVWHSESEREEELREEKKREETPQAASPKKASRLPDVFLLTSEMREYGKTKRPEIDLDLETEKFCNFWRSKGGKDANKLNWRLTWNNWILNAKGNGNGSIQRLNGNGYKSEREKSAERGVNAISLIAELERQGIAEEQALLGKNGGIGSQNDIIVESTESH